MMDGNEKKAHHDTLNAKGKKIIPTTIIERKVKNTIILTEPECR